MPVIAEYIELSTRGNADVVDITADVQKIVGGLTIESGTATVCCIGSTGAVTTCEFEPGLVQDIGEVLDKLIPAGRYHHDRAWGDGNGHAHLRSTLVGTSFTVPFSGRKLILGTWQQIIFIDFDNRPRRRRIVVQCLGE